MSESRNNTSPEIYLCERKATNKPLISVSTTAKRKSSYRGPGSCSMHTKKIHPSHVKN